MDYSSQSQSCSIKSPLFAHNKFTFTYESDGTLFECLDALHYILPWALGNITV